MDEPTDPVLNQPDRTLLEEEPSFIRNSPLHGLQEPAKSGGYVVVEDTPDGDIYVLQVLRREPYRSETNPLDTFDKRIHMRVACKIMDPADVFSITEPLSYQELLAFQLGRRYLSKNYTYLDPNTNTIRRYTYDGSGERTIKLERDSVDFSVCAGSFDEIGQSPGNLGINTYLAYKLIKEAKDLNFLEDSAQKQGMEIDTRALKQGFVKLISQSTIDYLIKEEKLGNNEIENFLANAGYWLYALTNKSVNESQVTHSQTKGGYEPRDEIAPDRPFPVKMQDPGEFPDVRALPYIFIAFQSYYNLENLSANVPQGKLHPYSAIIEATRDLYEFAQKVIDTQLGSATPQIVEMLQMLDSQFTPIFEEILREHQRDPGAIHKKSGRSGAIRYPGPQRYRENLAHYNAAAGNKLRSREKRRQ